MVYEILLVFTSQVSVVHLHARKKCKNNNKKLDFPLNKFVLKHLGDLT